MSSSPLVLHIVRPYATVDEYLAAEAWTIDARAMILVDVAELPADTAILFDVALTSGEKLIRAEGKVAATIAAQGNRPGGLRVKFKRYGATTKAFIDRAVQTQRAAQSADLPPVSVAPVSVAPVSVAPISRHSVTELELQKAEAATTPAVIEVSPPPPMPPLPAPGPAPESRPEMSAPSGVRMRDAGPVDAPAERESLLARLRERAQHVDLDSIPQRVATARAS